MTIAKNECSLAFLKRFSVTVSLMLFFTVAFSQDVSWVLNGTVLNEAGEPVAGASASIVGTSKGVQTENDGKFIIEVNSPTDSLMVSAVGFVSQTVFIGIQKIIVVRLKQDLERQKLDEVVVVGFGTQKKREVVGSVVSVKPSDLVIPASNLTTAFAGKIAGMIAYQRSGEPGADDADFFIRGVTSFGLGKVDPLILIDQVELSRTDLARLKPDDIESFSVMKDATATAVYGARGANGVISVITKKGREGRAKVDFRTEGAISMPTRNIEFADPVTYMKLYNEAFAARNPFFEPYYSQRKIDATAEGGDPILYPAVDWRKTMFKDYAITHRHNLSVRGGGKIARYYVTGSYSQDNGVLRVDRRNNFNNNADFKTYTLRSNVDVDLTKTTQMIVRLTGNFDDYNGPRQGAAEMYNLVVRSSPVAVPPYYPKDSAHAYIDHIMFGGKLNESYINPYAQMVSGYRQYDRSLMMAQLEFKQDLSAVTDGLRFEVLMNISKNSRYEVHRAYNPFYYDITYSNPSTGRYDIDVINLDQGTEYLNFANIGGGRVQTSAFYAQGTMNYSRLLNGKHQVNGMLVGIARSSSTGTAGNLELSLPGRNVGLSGRTTYGFDNRYFAEFNFGYNASERFDRNNRWGFFPSAGVAWTISNEKFMESAQNVISNLKLRATYGVVGNDAIGSANDRFFYLSSVSMGGLGATFGENWGYTRPGVTTNRYANPSITWEKATKANLALEVGLGKSFQLTTEFYQEHRSNILMGRAHIPTTMGLSAGLSANVGQAVGRGVDISTTYDHRFGNGIWTQFFGNFTYATAKFKVIEEPVYDKEYWLTRVGTKLSQPYAFLAERLFVDDAEVYHSPSQLFGIEVLGGDIKYKDVNGDGKITWLDVVPMGFPTTPEIIYGFGFSAGYGRFDISTFFQGLSNESFWIGGSGPATVEPFVGGKQILKVFADDHYSLENPDVYALYPRLSSSYNPNNMLPSNWWLRNGKFLRLKQAEIGFTLADSFVKRMKMQKFRIYVNGSNLLTFAKFNLWDIEMGGNGLGYPVQRVFNIGINAGF